MNSKVRVLGAICAFMVAGVSPRGASASSTTDKIANIQITGTSFAKVYVTLAVGGRPSCHNGGTTEYAFDVSTNKGRALLSIAQAALLAGKYVSIIGGSTCTTIGGQSIETLQTLTLNG
jgi:hypothetical protein